MGAADIVPGISGGTVALITGIYDELIKTISSVNLATFQFLFQGKFKEFWDALNGNFLLPLGLGLFSALILMARVMSFLLTNYGIYTWSLFFGLILALQVLYLLNLPIISETFKKIIY